MPLSSDLGMSGRGCIRASFLCLRSLADDVTGRGSPAFLLISTAPPDGGALITRGHGVDPAPRTGRHHQMCGRTSVRPLPTADEPAFAKIVATAGRFASRIVRVRSRTSLDLSARRGPDPHLPAVNGGRVSRALRAARLARAGRLGAAGEPLPRASAGMPHTLTPGPARRQSWCAAMRCWADCRPTKGWPRSCHSMLRLPQCSTVSEPTVSEWPPWT
jgi:hypothetical protein